MSKEQLEARKAEAAKQRDDALAAANLAQGIILDCDYWLAQLELTSMVKAPEPEAQP
jgi:hypothetical protein